MTPDVPPIPPAVIEFAEKRDIVNIQPNLFWNKSYPYKGYCVYEGHAKNNKDNHYLILVNDKEIRLPVGEEIYEITQVYY